jgi:aarF domain-containing kinase
VFSPEGSFFREFLMDELVKSIDALSRDQLRALLSTLGLQNAALPVLLPGANRWARGEAGGWLATVCMEQEGLVV